MGKGQLLVLLKCFFRTYFIGSMYNTKGLQNLGLLYIMDPGLKYFYKGSAQGLAEARKRYLGHYNSHPYFLPFLVGYFLFLESKIAKGILPRDSLRTIKATTAYTLSALGDSFWGGSLLILWSFIEIILLINKYITLAFVFFISTFIFVQCFRFFVFWQGFNKGLSFFEVIKNMNLIQWSKRIKIINSILLIFIWQGIANLVEILPKSLVFIIGGVVIGISSFVVSQHHVLREILVIGGIVLLALSL